MGPKQDLYTHALKQCSFGSSSFSSRALSHPSDLTSISNVDLDPDPSLNLSHTYEVTLSISCAASVSRPGFEFRYSFLNVPVSTSHTSNTKCHFQFSLPFRSPLHSSIPNQQRRQPVQNLMSRSSEDIEECGVECAG